MLYILVSISIYLLQVIFRTEFILSRTKCQKEKTVFLDAYSR